jgi:multidrug efflux system outer membrane protein
MAFCPDSEMECNMCDRVSKTKQSGVPIRFRYMGRLSYGVWPVALALVFFAGCAVGPNYKRPQLDVPESFRGAPGAQATNSLADQSWQQMFPDATLRELIATALTNNYDLRIAIARVEQARSILTQARAGFLPQFNYQGTIGRGKNALGNTAFFDNGQTTDFFLLAGNVSWEIDLWGRIRRQNEAARAQFLASDENRKDILLTVISEMAQAYFRLLALDAELEIARSASNSFAESWRIFNDRLQNGVASMLETSRAEASLRSASAAVPEAERQIILQENLINLLSGRNPGPVPRSRTLLQQQLPPEVPPGLPSALLERRPDIRQREQLLRAANAQVGVAVADFFPQISLSGLLGQVSPELSLFTSGAANAWSVAANLTGPLFQGGRLTGQYRQARAIWDQTRLEYESTVLTAFREVADSLTSVQKLAESRVEQTRAVQANELAVDLSRDRYIAGRAGYFELLEAQQQLFPAQTILVQIQLNQYLALVQLYKALGGGFRQ